MTETEQQMASLFADLASIADPVSLSPGQRLVLQERATAIFGFPPDVDQLLRQPRAWLIPLLRGDGVVPSLPFLWRLHNGVIQVGLRNTGPNSAFIGDLVRLIHATPFPFKQCPVCQKVFVSQTKKKRYCSANCTYRGIEEARKERRRPQAKARMQRLRAARKQAEAVKKEGEVLAQRALRRRHTGKPLAGAEIEEQMRGQLKQRQQRKLQKED